MAPPPANQPGAEREPSQSEARRAGVGADGAEATATLAAGAPVELEEVVDGLGRAARHGGERAGVADPIEAGLMQAPTMVAFAAGGILLGHILPDLPPAIAAPASAAPSNSV